MKFLCFSVLCISTIESTNKPAYVIEGLWMGFFGNFYMVLGGLEAFENGDCNGIEVSFNRSHCYFDESMGSNWWEYYFTPIRVGNLENKTNASTPLLVSWAQKACGNKRIYNNYLINKYIKIKPEILAEIEEFCITNDFFPEMFENSQKFDFIGVHYRGTDKLDPRYAEASYLAHEDVLCHMMKIKETNPNARFFIATDEEMFLQKALLVFGDSILYHEQTRSTTQLGTHNMKEIPNYIKGKDALIDCILLSKCQLLLRMCSNLSRVSASFNPNIKVVSLNYPDSVHWTAD